VDFAKFGLVHPASSMYTIIRTDAAHPEFQTLVKYLDQTLAISDGEEHAFYDQFNKIDKIKHAVVAYDDDDTAVGCGAIREFEMGRVEVKRMYVVEQMRGKGVAKAILAELENWAKELGFHSCILETGLKQPEAIQLYHKAGYQIIDNYGPYIGVTNSVCFEKVI
jgi:putative acetyltransferase